MNRLAAILTKSIAAPYYRQHSGFFLFVFFLLFGTQPSLYNAIEFHYAIIKSILGSFTFFMVAVLIWLVYSVKAAHFVYNNLQKDAFRFLTLLNALPARQRLFLLLRLQSQLFMPVWGYFFVIVIVALKDGYYAGLIYVTAALLLINAIAVLLYNFFLQRGKLAILNRFSAVRWPRRYPVFLLRFIFTEQFIALLILKVISFFTLYSLARLEEGVYEDRLLWMIYISVLIGHSMLIYKNHQFTEIKLGFYRNLPVSALRMLSYLGLVYLFLLLPEYWALKGVLSSQHAAMEYVWMLLTGPAMLLLMHCLLYTEDMKMEAYLQLLFGIWIVSIFFSLSANRWILPLVCLGMAGIVFFTAYYGYEKNAKTERLE